MQFRRSWTSSIRVRMSKLRKKHLPVLTLPSNLVTPPCSQAGKRRYLNCWTLEQYSGTVRLCFDFKKFNSQTIKDAYALPNLEEVFSELTGSKWFSVLDLKSGFYQIEMEEADKCKTAFVCPFGFWEFNRMPQGITNVPSMFHRLMERCMGDLNRKLVLVFIDDLIVFSETLEEHESRLLKVLNRLKEYGLKFLSGKCRFFQTSVRY